LLTERQPHATISALIAALPNATALLAAPDAEGLRPLHTAFMHGASEATLQALVAAHPTAAALDFGNGTEDTNGDGVRDGRCFVLLISSFRLLIYSFVYSYSSIRLFAQVRDGRCVLEEDDLVRLAEVSVLLFTVTFYANLAHSLTRSP
jgi:hypothetical protein